MNKVIRYIPILFLLMFIVIASSSCSKEKEVPTVQSDLEIVLQKGKWVYYSFETGKIIGTSNIASKEEDEQFESRMDWDVAFCQDGIKTNSGTSGQGNGGIINLPEANLNNIIELPTQGYVVDKDNMEIKKQIQ